MVLLSNSHTIITYNKAQQKYPYQGCVVTSQKLKGVTVTQAINFRLRRTQKLIHFDFVLK